LLHLPQMALRNDDSDGLSMVAAVQRLFSLQVVAAATTEADEDQDGAETAQAAEHLIDDKKAAGR
jgi:hypothetical protein